MSRAPEAAAKRSDAMPWPEQPEQIVQLVAEIPQHAAPGISRGGGGCAVIAVRSPVPDVLADIGADRDHVASAQHVRQRRHHWVKAQIVSDADMGKRIFRGRCRRCEKRLFDEDFATEAGLRQLLQIVRMARRLGGNHHIVRMRRRNGLRDRTVVATFAPAYRCDPKAELAQDARMPCADRAEANHDGCCRDHGKTS
ncbi:hypothetical protein ABH994_004940 [Bradyrhizobium yuanmingense]